MLIHVAVSAGLSGQVARTGLNAVTEIYRLLKTQPKASLRVKRGTVQLLAMLSGSMEDPH